MDENEIEPYENPSFAKELLKSFAVGAMSMVGALAGMIVIGGIINIFGKDKDEQTSDQDDPEPVA